MYRYRRLARPEGRVRNVVWAVCAGTAVSLAIELTQVWLPNRTSSATDLCGNALGTFLGALLAGKLQSRQPPTEILLKPGRIEPLHPHD